MSTHSHHESEDLHYSEKASTAEQQKHATRTYSYKSCRRGDKDDEIYWNQEHKISIRVRNVSWRPIRASLVRELIGDVFDKDKARWKAGEEKRFSHNDQSHSIKWTVDQRDSMAQLYTYDIYGLDKEGLTEGREHPQGIWMQYHTLLGSGYVFNATDRSNAWKSISNEAKRLFVHSRPDPTGMQGDWTYFFYNEGNEKRYKLEERKDIDSWTKPEIHRTWLARVKTETIESGDILPYKFKGYDLQVLNDCKERLNVATLDSLVGNTVSKEIRTDPCAKAWVHWRITVENTKNGKSDFVISRYHPSDLERPYHTNSNKKIWITNATDNESYRTVRKLLESTSQFKVAAKDESRWILERREEEGRENGRLTLKEISNVKSKERKQSRHRKRGNDSDNESSSSTYSDSVWERKKVQSRKSPPSLLTGYTHTPFANYNPNLIWSGRPENLRGYAKAGIHKKGRDCCYYGYLLENKTGQNLWWDEIADSLLSKKLIIPKGKEKQEQGSLSKYNGDLMIELDHQSTSHRVMRLSNLGAASSGEPKNDIHERHKVKVYTMFEKDNPGEPMRDTSISIRNRLKGNISWNSTQKEIHRNRILLGRQYNAIPRTNQGTICEIVLKNNNTYLIDPTDQNNATHIHVSEMRQSSSIPTFSQIRYRSPSSGQHTHRSGADTYNSSSDDSQRENRKSKTQLPIEYYQPSRHKLPSTINSSSSSSERENPSPYINPHPQTRTRHAQNIARSEHQRNTRHLPDYTQNRNYTYNHPTHSSSSSSSITNTNTTNQTAQSQSLPHKSNNKSKEPEQKK
ncbi:hypothetical protein OCU04_007168 [Sclerotinia nivalis]|uniref:Uncharacterized protein n=1 Tax=Sclerotinia nivalis TaxID=352851 RepID=A0A9X0AL95_9HELO|nr:hypothetical protein OCU04_007168 [Sclerotinia nivalis]